MQDPIKVLAKILTNILTALYEPFGFSLLLSFLAMFFYLYAYGAYRSRQRLEKRHNNMVSEIQGECVLSEAVFTDLRDIDDPV